MTWRQPCLQVNNSFLPGLGTISKTKIKQFCSKLNDHMDTVGRLTSDGERALPASRPTTIPSLGLFVCLFLFCFCFVFIFILFF